MTEIPIKIGTSSSTTHSDLSCPQLPLSTDCSPFLNWTEDTLDSEEKKAVVFRSLVATVKLQPVLDDSLEAKAVRFLESVHLQDGREPADAFLGHLASVLDETLTAFIQSIVVLISTPSQPIIKASMKMLDSLFASFSKKIRLALLNADLIPRLFIALNAQSLSFAETVDIHVHLLKMLRHSLWLAYRRGLAQLEIEDGNEQLAVHETILKQVLVPSEQYICHLCENRFSIIDGNQSWNFLDLLARLLLISPYYQPTMEFTLHMPIVPMIPSCLTFFENDASIWYFLILMITPQREWNDERGAVQNMWKTMHRMLRKEGIEDVIEAKLGNDKSTSYGRSLVDKSIEWNKKQGMNVPEQE
ncbi:hypothetical protein BLNAU_11084 [Blattamonas nauphoetae]|uniref:Uncharacterized protein n=1 Tax=Blattamonas nauphoetae TaxID=2049346 RepID=A0ABQ9XSG9_9EUKA|nr:hypothetical protein BLNAU_11084 [Blattamonas nauphoetae]